MIPPEDFWKRKGVPIIKPVIVVFIDALKAESIDRMDFLRTLVRRKVKTELGFSSTCHASMYTGVHLDKHMHWFIWQYSRANSPFSWLKRFQLYRLPSSKYLKYFWYCLACQLQTGMVPYGFLCFLQIPMDCWGDFSLTMVDFIREPQPLLGNYPTLFKILKDNNVAYEIVGMQRRADKAAKTMAQHKLLNPRTLTFYYIGDIDPLSHNCGQESPPAVERLKFIDRAIEQKYRALEREFNDFYFIVFSDHGHIDVKGRVNLASYFEQDGKDINDYLYFLDACYARFWFRNDTERAVVEKVLTWISDKGFILRDEIMEKYHARVPDNRYGHLIFYLKPPNVFDVANPRTVSMHGYLPDEPGYDGIFVTNKAIKDKSYVELVDVMPSVLDAIGLKIPEYVDGESLWQK